MTASNPCVFVLGEPNSGARSTESLVRGLLATGAAPIRCLRCASSPRPGARRAALLSAPWCASLPTVPLRCATLATLVLAGAALLAPTLTLEHTTRASMDAVRVTYEAQAVAYLVDVLSNAQPRSVAGNAISLDDGSWPTMVVVGHADVLTP